MAVTAELGEIPLQVIGIGATKLNRSLLERSDGIVLAGLAGALDPTLAVGDIVVDSRSGEPPAWSGRFREGKFHAAGQLVSTAAEKRRLFRETGCAAVDMESGIVGAMAESLHLPMLHVRAISDACDDELPPRLMSWIDDIGRLRAMKLLVDLALHPQQIRAVIRLGRNSHLALQQLAQALGVILQQ
jgi:uridine phosphorylase